MSNGTSHEHAHEVRLGLVMYGGVSLAVYINGVANELFRAVRGRGVYRLLKELTDADIAVDVVSGTSAGGINGILLGFALCNSREFGPSTQIWREGADIGSLLRNPGDEDFPSLLDSEQVYQPRLEQVLDQMWVTPIDEPDDDATVVRELDLFVTGTDYNGRLSTTLDEAGHSIDVKDHRALFWLKHRQGRKEQLHPETDAAGRRLANPDETSERAGIVALAKLARITSCFPAAFTPVVIPARDGETSESDDKLRMWGRLADDQSYCFLDGGVLDNKPFTSTLRTIFYRTADRPVRRHLLYVEPDPERFGQGAAPPFRVPSFTESALDSLTKLPGYESIADDLRLVAEHNDKIDRLARLRASIVDKGQKPSEAQRDLWRKARLSALRDAVLRQLLGVERGERLTDDLAKRAQELREHFDRQYLESIQESEFLLTDFDVGFRLRRLFHLTYVREDERELVAINREIEFLEIARHAMEEALARGTEARGTASPAEVWKLAFRRLTVLLTLDADLRPFPRSRPEEDVATPLSPGDLERTRRELDRRLAGLTAEAAPEGNNAFTASDRYEVAIARAFGGDFERHYAAYEALDTWLFPLEFVAGLHERDVIRVTRMSPIDARRGLCRRDLAEKLCGDSLAHFGAFFKRSWRANDILWGRLDGVCQLVETVAERDWLVDTLPRAAERGIFGCDRTTPHAERSERVLAWILAHQIFPRAGETRSRSIAGKLARLLDLAFAEADSAEATKGALSTHLQTAWSPLVDELVRAAHLDILDEELPKVVGDAALEQMQWNQQLDPLLRELASRELAQKALRKLRKRDDPTALEEYFRSYRVGSETIVDDIPRVVLLELGGRAALVAQQCLVESFPRPEVVRTHWLFRVCLDWPLRIFDATARFLRYAPGARKPFVVASVAYVALAVVVNALWFKALYVEDGMQRQVALLLFVVGPIVCGLFSWLMIRPFRSPRPSGFGARAGLLVALVVVGLALVATSRLLDADLSPYCGAPPLSALGEHCAVVTRGIVLLLPLGVGALLGGFWRSRERATRRRGL
jgi:patatin-related protein